MDNSEAMYWLAVVQQANKGDKEAMEVLRQEDEVRTEQGQLSVLMELQMTGIAAEVDEKTNQFNVEDYRRGGGTRQENSAPPLN